LWHQITCLSAASNRTPNAERPAGGCDLNKHGGRSWDVSALRVSALATVDQSQRTRSIEMRNIKVVGLALLAVFALSALVAAQASAAAEHIYKVEGKVLEAPEVREVKSSLKSEKFVLRGKGILNVESVTTCKKLKLKAAEKPVIEGGSEKGQTGKSSKEVIEFEECTATVGGTKCSGVEVSNAATNNELVSVYAPAGLKGKLATLFTPAEGKVFSKIKFKSCGLLGSPSAEITGSSAGLVQTEKVEAVKGALQYREGTEEITAIEKQNKTTEKVELDNEKTKKATLAGDAWIELTTGEKWGAF
jgi:hypothetical protein